MDIPGTLLSTTIVAAVNFIFNELQDILKEIRSRSSKEADSKNLPKQSDNKKINKDDVNIEFR